MFPKGPRFPPTKISDTPGPNTYDVQALPIESYKTGAFHAKTDRFERLQAPELASQLNTVSSRPPSQLKNNADTGDRYVALQRRLQDLERLHAEEKRALQTDLHSAQSDVSRGLKVSSELRDRVEKMKKQADGSDARIQELKKAAMADKTELRDLRGRLRTLEQERKQFDAKHESVTDAKKAAQAMDLRRREEVKERDRKIAELEKALSTEKRKVEAGEAWVKKAKGELEHALRDAQETTRMTQTQLIQRDAELERATSTFDSVRCQLGEEQDALLEQVHRLQEMLASAAREYGALVHSTVALAQYNRLRDDLTASRLHTYRLERKLANSDAQVREIAALVRQYADAVAFQEGHLQDVEMEIVHYQTALREAYEAEASSLVPPDSTAELLFEIGQERTGLEKTIRLLESEANLILLERHQLHASELMSAHQDAEGELALECVVAQRLTEEVKSARLAEGSKDAQLAAGRDALEKVECTLAKISQDFAETTQRAEMAEGRLTATEALMKREVAKVEKALETERETCQRLNAALYKSRMAEEALLADIESLNTALSEAEPFQQAYYNILDEVGVLVDRKALAEKEAEYLSRVNAEILGHRNPGQRIYYVDKIRKELATTKQRLLLSTRDREATIATNQILQDELDMYKSVSVPYEGKPRTAITRVSRVPLASLDPMNNKESVSAPPIIEEAEFSMRHIPEFEGFEGEPEMTMDELS